MLRSLLLCTFLFAVMAVQAQQRTISGVVSDDNGAPLENVSVSIKETQQGTTTDKQGRFSFSVSSSARTLIFSSIGYTAQEISLGSSNSYSIGLKTEAQSLAEVVMTGYGTTQRRSFTGTAATISNEKFKNLQVSTITGVLQGNASGVLAINSTGQPGENPTIRIRGVGSFNASNNPLIVVDGAPFSGSINSINPGDVESITVLKDASSTSIYGSRAANGIIQIVTKKGRGKARFSFSNVTGFSQRAVKEYERLNSSQFYELTWEALRNQAIATPNIMTGTGTTTPEAYASLVVPSRLVYNPFNVAQPVGLDGKIKADARLLWEDDWLDEMSRTGVRNETNFNMSGGENTVRYFLSGGYLHDQGIVNESDFKRYTGRAKIDATPTKWARIGINSSLAYSNQNYPYQGNSGTSNQLSFARWMGPVYTIYLRDPVTGEYLLDPTGKRIYDFGNNSAVTGVLRPTAQNRPHSVGQNPAATTSLNPITFERLTASGIVYAEFDLYKGLTFKTQYAADYNQIDQNLFWNPFYGDGITSGGYSYRGITNTYSQNFTNTLTYDRMFGKAHHINVVGGTEIFKQRSEVTVAEKTGFTFGAPTQPSYGTVSDASGLANSNRLQSYFGLIKYDLSEKYHLAASLRTDGSTRFAEDVRWGVFYSVGAAWNLGREKFMQGIDVLSELKLKASYGTSGNQALQDNLGNPISFPYLGTYSAGANIGSAPGSIINTIANFDLTWESQKQTDVGVEFGFLKNRITGSFVYFSRISDRLLFDRPLPASTGINSISDNTGGVRNYGYEIELNTVNFRKKDFQWRTSFNITNIRNRITIAAPGTTQRVGGSWYDWYIQEYAGADPADGLPMWYMDQVDPATSKVTKVTTKTYTDATRYYLGNRLADYTGGISNFLEYKNFDLSILASFSLGGEMYDVDYAGIMHSFNYIGYNAGTDILNRWQSPSNPGDGKTPKLMTANINADAVSTRFLYSSSYMRIRNITLGYKLPENILRKTFITNARIFADLQNPFTFFGGPEGTDPEAGINAQTGGNNTTSNKTFSVGLNIGF